MSPRESEDQSAKEAARESRSMMSNSASSSPGAVAVAPTTRKPSPRDQRIAEKNGQSLSDAEGLCLAPASSSPSGNRDTEEIKPPAKLSYFQADIVAKQRGRKTSPTDMPSAVPDSPFSPPAAFPFEVPQLTTEELFEKEAAKQHARRSPTNFSKPGAVASDCDVNVATKGKASQLGLSAASAFPDVLERTDHTKSSLVKEKSGFGLTDTPTRRMGGKNNDGMLSMVGKAKSVSHAIFSKGEAPPEQAPDLESCVYDPEANPNGLAVAVPVEEGEEDSYIANAVEYDPDAKPVTYRRRRFRLYALLAIFALISAATGAVVGVLLTDKGKSSSEETLPYRETLGIQNRVERLVGLESLEDPESPYSKALFWITHNDTMELVPESPNFVQRYILAYFYFGTTEDGEWRSCNPPVAGDDVNCTYYSLADINPETYTEEEGKGRWLSSLHECSWAAISCDEKQQVREIWPIGQKLSGPFPEGLKHLPFLQTVHLVFNGLHGTLPQDVVPNWIYLSDIDLQFNELTGSIPSDWFDAEQLIRMNLGNNKLNGTIPSEIGGMNSLRYLYLQDNLLSGRIPSGIGSLTTLGFLLLGTNLLTGPLPPEIGNLAYLDLFFAHKNLLTGSIPAEYGNLSQLSQLRLLSNERLGGALPETIYELVELERLDLRFCNFSGTLSSRIGEMTNLDTLRLAFNPLMNGPLPNEVMNLTLLSDVKIQGTGFTGEVPPELCGPWDTDFVRVEADCKATGKTEAELVCSCCSLCCDSEGLSCSTPIH